MKAWAVTLFAVCVGVCKPLAAQPAAPAAPPLEYLGKPVRGIPVSQAVRVGRMLFISGMPPFGEAGRIAVGDFPVQMKQVMENLTGVLKSSGAGWDPSKPRPKPGTPEYDEMVRQALNQRRGG